MDFTRKYAAIKDKKISGSAGPVIKIIGKLIRSIEKNKTSSEIDLSVNNNIRLLNKLILTDKCINKN